VSNPPNYSGGQELKHILKPGLRNPALILKILFILLAQHAPPAPLCPVKFTIVKGKAHFTGVAPADGTGVSPEDHTGVKSFVLYLTGV